MQTAILIIVSLLAGAGVYALLRLWWDKLWEVNGAVEAHNGRNLLIALDTQVMEAGRCPVCAAELTLLEVPSSDYYSTCMCQNCLGEFSVHKGPGGGLIAVERRGTCDLHRSETVYGMIRQDYINAVMNRKDRP